MSHFYVLMLLGVKYFYTILMRLGFHVLEKHREFALVFTELRQPANNSQMTHVILPSLAPGQ